ncbi:MAG TPA: chloride channel protein, partial [bacterium]|nr:chloride channel protein [bacterium]
KGKVQSFLADPSHLQTLAFWATAFLAGFVCVTYAGFFKVAEGFYRQIVADHPLMIWIWTPFCLLGSWALVAFLAPEASGSGIPQVMAANELKGEKNRSWADQLLSLKGVAVKITGSLIAGLGGAVLGREGPTIHISASIFRGVSRLFRKFRIQTDDSAWIVAGAAAGLAAAFNTPLGGIVFAIEEMSVHFKRFRTALISSIIIAGLVSQWILGSYLYLGYPHIEDIPFTILGPALLVGAISGFLGALYGQGLKGIVVWRGKFKTKTQLAFLALACGLVLAGLAFLDPHASGSGLDMMNSMLFKDEKAGWDLPFLRMVGSLAFYASGGAGGIFSPSLAAGACTGSALDSLLHSGSPHLLILLGMAGFLTGVTRTPFTAFVLVIEMTDHHVAIFPIMLSALTADLVARSLGRESFYEWAHHRFMAKPKV